jgi:shikimate dehydrogenase
MHNAAARALGLDIAYVPLPVPPDRVEAALQGLSALGFLGANVTVPHKQAVLPLLDTVEPAAQAIGAVNTIKVERNAQSPISTLQSPLTTLSGFNTDWAGFLADLRRHDIALKDRSCLVLGAGGSARAVVYALASAGAQVCVYARRPHQAQDLVQSLAPHLSSALLQWAAWDELQQGMQAEAPLLVNTTPVGMYPHEDQSPWPEGVTFPQGGILYDLIYNPRETRLMQQAREAGCQTINGLGMLLLQGALAFEIWLGVRPDLGVMEAAMEDT